jgi:hypothetical protein
MLEYICISIILLIFIPIIYIRIRYPFWSTQPIFHSYDYLRFLTKTPYEINSQVYPKAFKKDNNVHSFRFLDIDDKEFDRIVDLLQCHSVESSQMLSFIDKPTMNITHTGQFFPSYVSVYRKDKYDVTYDTNNAMSIVNTHQTVGCMTGRAINMFILDKSGVLHEKNGYFWDNICVHREYTQENIGRKLIQAHDIHQRTNTQHISISLFKKEIDLCEGVIPLVEYPVHTFTLSKIKRPPLPPPYSVSRMYNTNVEPFYNLLYMISHSNTARNTAFIAFPEISVLDNMIQNNILLVYGLSYGNHIKCVYVFKNPQLCYDNIKDGHILECITTITEEYVQDKTLNGLIFAGFLHALQHIQKSFSNKYKIITFHNLGQNQTIIERWKWKYTPLSKNMAAYYLYNGVIPGMPIDQSNCIIIT